MDSRRLARLLLVLLLGCAASKQESHTDPGSDVVETPQPASFDPMKGPAAELFDCTHPGIPETRYALAPVSCVVDPDCTDRLVVGHRSAGGEYAVIAPENSLAGIRAALWMGLDGVELDVRHTADDKLVIMHDATVDRTTLGKGTVSEMTLAQVTALHLKPQREKEVARYAGDFTCEKVPTLAEALELTRDKLFVDLDTKTSRVDLVVPAIVALGLKDQVFISVSDAKRAAEARAIDPSIRVQVRPDTPSELEQMLSLFDSRPPDIVEIPSNKIKALAPGIMAVGAKVFSDVFEEDVISRLVGLDKSNYIKYFNGGAQILQSEFPGAILDELGRNSASVGLLPW